VEELLKVTASHVN